MENPSSRSDPQAAASGSIEDDEVRRVAAFLTRLFPEPRPFDMRLWDGTRIAGAPGSSTSEGSEVLTIVINDAGAVRRMFRPPIELRLGEAFLNGDFDLEGDVTAAGPALGASRSAVVTPREAAALARLWAALPLRRRRARRIRSRPGATPREAPAQLRAAELSPEWDREGIQYHYDVGNDFFELFLDSRMVYSCAYYPTGEESLDEAQEAKLDLICRKLRLREGDRLLDIGCGWGALVIHAAQRYGARALGVTLSEQQYDLARRRVEEAGLADRVEVRLTDYREVRNGPFDKVASIGMFEHVGRERLPEYFAHVIDLLKPGGLFLNHGIALRPANRSRFRAALEPLLVGGDNFRRRYVFPSGGLVPISEANLAAELAGFEVRDVENLREHYALTLREWTRRLEVRQDEAVRIGGARMYRLWRMYMGIAAWQFEIGDLQLGQTLLQRLAGRPSDLPATRADLYA